MGWQATKSGRWARRGAIAAALISTVSLIAPSEAKAEKANSGAGVVHGITEFDPPGLPASQCTVGGAGDNVGFDVNGHAPSFVYNTVITGFVGAIRITGRGNSRCNDGPVRNGTLELSVTGTGPTGSRIACPSLSGGFVRVGTVVTVELFGDCFVNDYGTGRVQFLAGLQFTPFEPVGSPANNQNIEKAYFDGGFVLVPVVS